ncbi:MAG: FAD:protein FMN transferase [Muribaculaceae bacterium]|nr:FAD:protein FMN transferase [Muribaculaceae bacterium]
MKSLVTAFILLSVVCCGCDRAPSWHYASGSTWGTVYHIKYRGARDLSDSITAVMRAVDMSLSPFEKASAVSSVNAGQDVRADAMLCDVIVLSQRVCSISSGAFDPTVAPLVNLWGFGYRDGAADVPDSVAINEALASVGVRECRIDTDMRVHKKSPDTEFNFSAIAKGYGVDMIAAMLRRNGCSDYMVEVGGEIALDGDGPSGRGWNIQIDAPVDDNSAPGTNRLATINLTGRCIATSGNYRNHRSTSQGEVGHTISPVTGQPVATSTLSATVLAPTTALADALATAMMVMPADSAMKMVEGLPEVDALIVTARPDSSLGTWSTFRFQ